MINQFLFSCQQANNTSNKVEIASADDSIPVLSPVTDWYAEVNYQLTILKNISGNRYGDETGILVETKKFTEASEVVSHLNDTLPDSTKKIIDQLKTALINKQIKIFPLLRKSFIELTGKSLQEDNIAVTGNGTTINMASDIFAAKRNIVSIQQDIQPQLELLRFKQISYRSHKNASEYTNYKIDSKEDADISFSVIAVQ